MKKNRLGLCSASIATTIATLLLAFCGLLQPRGDCWPLQYGISFTSILGLSIITFAMIVGLLTHLRCPGFKTSDTIELPAQGYPSKLNMKTTITLSTVVLLLLVTLLYLVKTPFAEYGLTQKIIGTASWGFLSAVYWVATFKG